MPGSLRLLSIFESLSLSFLVALSILIVLDSSLKARNKRSASELHCGKTRHLDHAVPNIPLLHRLSFRDNTELIRVEEQVYRLRAQLDDRFLALEKSQSDSRIMKAFTDLVEQGKQQFNAELKALMPDIKLNESG